MSGGRPIVFHTREAPILAAPTLNTVEVDYAAQYDAEETSRRADRYYERGNERFDSPSADAPQRDRSEWAAAIRMWWTGTSSLPILSCRVWSSQSVVFL